MADIRRHDPKRPACSRKQVEELSDVRLAGDLTLHVTDAELAKRKANWRPPTMTYDVGYLATFAATAGQAEVGCVANLKTANS